MPHSRLRALQAMDPDAKVRVYTRQDPRAWELALQRGYLSGDREHVEESWLYPYDWMQRQMAQRVPGFSGDLPVWGWLKRQNERKWGRPEYGRARTTPRRLGTRVIALVPRKRVLISCYDLWHFPLNNWHLAQSQEESDAHDARWPTWIEPGTNADYQSEVEQHWDTVFWPNDKLSLWQLQNYARHRVVPQACVDRVYLDEVVSVRWHSPSLAHRLDVPSNRQRV